MVDLGKKSDFRWGHRVVVWQEELQFEDAAFVGRLCGTIDGDIEVSQVLFVWYCIDTGYAGSFSLDFACPGAGR